MGTFVVKQRNNGKYYFELKAINGSIILSSYNNYESISAIENTIEYIKINSENINQFERKESSNGMNYFVLKAKNGQIIGKSEHYTSKAACENVIYSVMKNAKDSKIIIE